MPPSDCDAARIYKQRAAAVGLEAKEIAGRSTRIGAVQDLLAAGYSSAEIMREVGWNSERMFRYTEHLQARGGARARRPAPRQRTGSRIDRHCNLHAVRYPAPPARPTLCSILSFWPCGRDSGTIQRQRSYSSTSYECQEEPLTRF